jgi:hypothetical protein
VSKRQDTITALLDQLERFNAAHPLQKQALELTLRSVRWATRDGWLTLILGPSRVGKSHLLDLIEASLPDLYPSAPAAVRVKAPPETNHHAFSMNVLLTEFLVKLGDPAPEKHVITSSRLPANFPTDNTKTGSAKLLALRNRMQLRHPAAAILDEAGYLAMGSQRQKIANMRDLTYLGEETHVPIILAGTYDGVDLPTITEDVNSRVRLVHLPRYRNNAEDSPGFIAAVGAFDEELRRLGLTDRSLSLLNHAPLLWESAHGRVGLLAILLRNAADLALTAGRCVRVADLREAERHLVANPSQFKAKAIAGETKMREMQRYLPESAAEVINDLAPKHPTPVTAPSLPVGERRTSRDVAFAALPRQGRSARSG